MEITSLFNNETKKNSKTKKGHGLALLIEYQKTKVLLDFGESVKIFKKNCATLGVNLKEVTFAVLSHHHFDHSGALEYFLKENSVAKVYIKQLNEYNNQYFKLGDIKKYIGIKKRILKEFKDRFIFVEAKEEAFQIDKNFSLVTKFLQKSSKPSINKFLKKKVNKKYEKDDFAHELALIGNLNEKEIVVFSSCSHNGIINICESAKTQLQKEISYIIGGFHLGTKIFKVKKKEIEKIGKQFLEFNPKMVYTMHCSGFWGFKTLKKTMKDKIKYLYCGEKLKLSKETTKVTEENAEN